MIDQAHEVYFDATPEQIDMITDPAHIKVWGCGRRWGKSISFAIDLATVALENPGCTVWYVSPRYARSLKMMRIMRKCKPFMELVAKTSMQFPPRLEMKNGSEICFISADREDELRGEGLKLVCVDEAAILTPHLFYEVLMPMTADSGGTIIAASTFNGRNWFYDLAVSSMAASKHAEAICKGTDEDAKTWIYPSDTGYAFTGSDKKLANLERLKRRTPPMVWKQEYECQPLAMVDAVFKYVDQCITSAVPRMGPDDGHFYICAQDIGRLVDKSAVVVMDIETGEIVFCENYDLGVPHREQAAKTKATSEFWNNALVCLDTTGGEGGGDDESFASDYIEVIGNLRAVTFTQDRKRNMVNRLGLDFETKKISIPHVFTELISQLKLYRYVFGEKAILPTFFGRPDDMVAAAMMCTWARSQRWASDANGRPIGSVGV